MILAGFDLEAIELVIRALGVLKDKELLIQEGGVGEPSAVTCAVLRRLGELAGLEVSTPYTIRNCDETISEAILLVSTLRAAYRPHNRKPEKK